MGRHFGRKKCEAVLWDRDNWGTITSKWYVDNVLVPVIQPFWEREGVHTAHPLWLMEDGASAHRAHNTRQIQEQFGILKLNWPPAPLDLNPIENVWFLLKDRLNKRHPQPQALEGMGEAIKEEWDGISEVHLLTFVDSMPERIQAVITASGGHTRW